MKIGTVAPKGAEWLRTGQLTCSLVTFGVGAGFLSGVLLLIRRAAVPAPMLLSPYGPGNDAQHRRLQERGKNRGVRLSAADAHQLGGIGFSRPEVPLVSQDSSRRIRLDGAWLDGLGYGDLAESQKRQILGAAYDALEYKVGDALTRMISNELLGQFEHILDHPQQEVAEPLARQFLQDNLPNYRETVLAALQQLANELRLIRVDFDDLRQSRGGPSGMEQQSEQIPLSPRPGISDAAHLESRDDAAISVDPSVSQEQRGPDR